MTDLSNDPLFLGIDTGGTYTDAVLWSQERGIVSKAKALTTRHDLSVGIEGAANAAIVAASIAPAAIKLVSMSTTLATNALVEGQGGRVCLVMIGFGEADLDRGGLRQALGTDPVIFLPGGHDKAVRQIIDSPRVHELQFHSAPATPEPPERRGAADGRDRCNWSYGTPPGSRADRGTAPAHIDCTCGIRRMWA